MKTNYYILLLSLLLVACSDSTKQESDSNIKIEHLKGETMGTTFSVTYWDTVEIDLIDTLQKLLTEINYSVSTYVKDSEISKFNQKDSLEVSNKGHFARNFELSNTIYKQTDGWFNPTVMPLVNYWGFGYTKKERQEKPNPTTIDSLLELVNFEKIVMQKKDSSTLFVKEIKGLELDFSAIAKGDGVDEVGRLLERNGIHNYFVEIGGELRTRGLTSKGFAWRTGIRKPKEKSAVNDLQMILELKDIALATSGNYENYHEDPNTGQKYAHTINPSTGYPEKNNLLSASVFAKDCATADAFATAFMAMGLEKAWEIVNKDSSLEAYFIYVDKTGKLQEKMTSRVMAMQLK